MDLVCEPLRFAAVSGASSRWSWGGRCHWWSHLITAGNIHSWDRLEQFTVSPQTTVVPHIQQIRAAVGLLFENSASFGPLFGHIIIHKNSLSYLQGWFGILVSSICVGQ